MIVSGASYIDEFVDGLQCVLEYTQADLDGDLV